MSYVAQQIKYEINQNEISTQLISWNTISPQFQKSDTFATRNNNNTEIMFDRDGNYNIVCSIKHSISGCSDQRITIKINGQDKAEEKNEIKTTLAIKKHDMMQICIYHWGGCLDQSETPFLLIQELVNEEIKENEEKVNEVKSMDIHDKYQDETKEKERKDEIEINEKFTKEDKVKNLNEKIEAMQHERDELLRQKLKDETKLKHRPKIKIPTNGDIIGTIYSPQNKGISNISIKLFNIDQQEMINQTISDKEGKFVFSNVTGGHYNMMINDNGNMLWNKEYKQITMPDGGSITESITLLPLIQYELYKDPQDENIMMHIDNQSGVSVSILSNDIVNSNGKNYCGKVNVSIATIDPNFPEQLNAMPHFQTSENPNGPLLETFGAMYVEVTDEFGNLLNVNNITANIPKYGDDPQMGLWYLKPGESKWIPIMGGSKQVNSFSGRFPGSGWFNLDKQYQPTWQMARLTNSNGNYIPYARVQIGGVENRSNVVSRSDKNGWVNVPVYNGKKVQVNVSSGNTTISKAIEINKNEIQMDFAMERTENKKSPKGNIRNKRNGKAKKNKKRRIHMP